MPAASSQDSHEITDIGRSGDGAMNSKLMHQGESTILSRQKLKVPVRLLKLADKPQLEQHAPDISYPLAAAHPGAASQTSYLNFLSATLSR